MANNKTKNTEIENTNIDPVDMGLTAPEAVEETDILGTTGEPLVEKTKGEEAVEKYEEKKLNAAATAALKAAVNANAETALRESEKEYAIAKRKYMLEKCKSDPVVTITPSKLFANIFGSVYTFNYNGIPVTVYFNSKPQKFPKFIADKIQEKILSTSEANTYKEEIEHLS